MAVCVLLSGLRSSSLNRVRPIRVSITLKNDFLFNSVESLTPDPSDKIGSSRAAKQHPKKKHTHVCIVEETPSVSLPTLARSMRKKLEGSSNDCLAAASHPLVIAPNNLNNAMKTPSPSPRGSLTALPAVLIRRGNNVWGAPDEFLPACINVNKNKGKLMKINKN